MLDRILTNTSAFLDSIPKSQRKKIGQFFTSRETAEYMASMFDFNNLPKQVSVLDAGAGTGILSAALVERLEQSPDIEAVHLTCYENDHIVIPLLKQNLEHIAAVAKKQFSYTLIEDDYLLTQAGDFEFRYMEDKTHKYDLIIGNPPYLRVLKDHEAAIAMPSVVHGAPNLYFLFAAMGLFNLKADCEMVYIIPRSWTSGAYFKAFRDYFLTDGKLEHIHLFISRDKVFSQEQVLQETIIIKVKKTDITPENVLLTSSNSNYDFNNITELTVPYSSVVTGSDNYVFLPTTQEDIDTIQKINKYSKTMPDYGYKMKTGIIVDFRQYDDLRQDPEEHTLPVFYSQHIKNGRVNHDKSGKEYEWVIDTKPGLIQENKDYVFCKRFTAKEERRRLQCGIYLASDFPDYQYIGTQNKINFVERLDKKPQSKEMVFGIFALLNSTLFDNYYRILNGSTQVNSTEINSIPVPDCEVIETMGKRLIAEDDLSTEACDKVLEVAYGCN